MNDDVEAVVVAMASTYSLRERRGGVPAGSVLGIEVTLHAALDECARRGG